MSTELQARPQPSKTFIITQRVWNMKYVFTSANDTQVLYYILAPPKYKYRKHACGWSAIVHAGDNPKYHTLAESPVVGRCKRAILWNKFYIEYGGSIQREVKQEEKEIKELNLKWANRFRKLFCTEPKELKWTEEEEAAVTEDEKGQGRGPTKLLEVEHFGHRHYEFEVDGRRYRWTGTRMHAGKFINWSKLKGFAFHLKLIRVDDHKLVASFKKTYWSCFNKGKFGELNFYFDEHDDVALDEVVIVQTTFCMAKSEKEKREKIREILQEIGENAGGGG